MPFSENIICFISAPKLLFISTLTSEDTSRLSTYHQNKRNHTNISLGNFIFTEPKIEERGYCRYFPKYMYCCLSLLMSMSSTRKQRHQGEWMEWMGPKAHKMSQWWGRTLCGLNTLVSTRLKTRRRIKSRRGLSPSPPTRGVGACWPFSTTRDPQDQSSYDVHRNAYRTDESVVNFIFICIHFKPATSKIST